MDLVGLALATQDFSGDGGYWFGGGVAIAGQAASGW